MVLHPAVLGLGSSDNALQMHPAPVTCLTFVDDQVVASGSSLGNVSVTDLSTGQQVATMRSRNLADIRTLCLHHSSKLLFAASTSGHVSCLDLRKLRSLWETRVSSNVIYSMNHLQNDSSLLVTGGIDGVIRTLDQNNGEVTSRCIMDESTAVPYSSTDKFGLIGRRKGRRLPEDARLDLMPKTSRPLITCLAVGMQKIVTTHNEKYIRVWRFGNEKEI
ncbi:hypothetical protein LIER_19921 [Lithospermum erythrorhizon]|uniref:Uncharacterized protein n=1 Tax=Lithospermum erythrorhizon TaxID=34254 RepID=A0AAV3QM83_LITER